MKRADTFTSLAFLAVGLITIYVAAGYPPEARLIPVVVAAAIVVVSAIQLAASVVHALRPLVSEDPLVAFADAPSDRRQWTRAGVAALSVVGLFGLVYFVGIVIGITVYLLVAFWVLARQRTLVIIAATIVAFILTYGMFVGLMELPLLGGILR